MMRKTVFLIVACTIITVLGSCATAPLPVKWDTSIMPQRYSGVLINMTGTPTRKSSARITIHIEQFSSEEEVHHYLDILKKDGEDALYSEVFKAKAKGWISIDESLGYEVAVIRNLKTENGQIIRVITDRPIQFAEVMRSLRTRDYPFGIIELVLKDDGTGEGTMNAAARARFTDDGKVEVESYGTTPFKIVNLRPVDLK
jgi:hypothetical protein